MCNQKRYVFFEDCIAGLSSSDIVQLKGCGSAKALEANRISSPPIPAKRVQPMSADYRSLSESLVILENLPCCGVVRLLHNSLLESISKTILPYL